MPHQFTTSYLQDSIAVFRQTRSLGERALSQCPDDALTVMLDPESNSIATIIKHMTGNMRSRWTDFLTTDGEKPDRNRDSEFETPASSRAELLAQWNQGWDLVFTTLNGLTEADMTRTVTIRNEPHSVMQAINRQIGHYSYHVGQIVFLAKHFGSANWQSLTIPRHKSSQFNSDVSSGKSSQR